MHFLKKAVNSVKRQVPFWPNPLCEMESVSTVLVAIAQGAPHESTLFQCRFCQVSFINFIVKAARTLVEQAIFYLDLGVYRLRHYCDSKILYNKEKEIRLSMARSSLKNDYCDSLQNLQQRTLTPSYLKLVDYSLRMQCLNFFTNSDFSQLWSKMAQKSISQVTFKTGF